MKQQCTTAAQCLKELARVMDQFGIIDPVDALHSRFIKYSGARELNGNNMPQFSMPSYWQFAIAEVEGKPVFIGDELYDSETGLVKIGIEKGITVRIDGKNTSWNWDRLSWNPPKPKTVMVEMNFEDAQILAGFTPNSFGAYRNACFACKKALEQIK